MDSSTSPGIHFVFEKPQKRHGVRSQKKRSRLISSCDSCRSKKIKCKPSIPNIGTCETCLLAGIPCLYEERDKIRAERGIASFTVSATPLEKEGVGSIMHHGGQSSTELTVNGRGLPPVSSQLQNETYIQSIFSPELYSEISISDNCSQSTQERQFLFNINRPLYSNSHLMSHFVALFFTFSAGGFAFMDFQETMFRVQTGSLSPLLANCIAAFAIRFSTAVDHTGPRYLSAEPYLNMAKSLLTDAFTLPTLETIHALLILATAEYGAGRSSGLWTYGRAAATLGQQLKITTEENIRLIPDELIQHKCRLTFWSVMWTDIMSSSAAGSPNLYRLDSFSPDLPMFAADIIDSISQNRLYRALRDIFIIMKELDDISFASAPNVPSLIREEGLGKIRKDVANYLDTLSDDLLFNLPNMRTVASNEYAANIFIRFNLLYHCVVVVVHCPSMFWTIETKTTPSIVANPSRAEYAWASARSIIDILQTARNIDERLVTGGPQLFMPLSVSRSALLIEKACLDGHPPLDLSHALTYSRESNEAYLNNCRALENCLSQIWQPVLSKPSDVRLLKRSLANKIQVPLPLAAKTLSMVHNTEHHQSGSPESSILNYGAW